MARCARLAARMGARTCRLSCALLSMHALPLPALRQRGSRAVPALMQRRITSRPPFCMAEGDRVEAASGVVWSVLKEDVMLSISTEVRHSCLESELRE